MPEISGRRGRECSGYNQRQGVNPRGGESVSDDLQRLLKYIVHHYTWPEEVKDIELDASPLENGGDIAASRRRALRDVQQRAELLADAFRDGLKRASAAQRAGGNAISLDDRVPEDNRIADAMIRFLVGTGLAYSTTRETDPLHYIYTVSVDWSRLNSVAREARVDLGTAIK